MSIRTKLLQELDFLIGMLPQWDRAERDALGTYWRTRNITDFREALDYQYRKHYAHKQIEWINSLLADDDAGPNTPV